MNAKQITISKTESLEMNEQGQWTLIDAEFGLRERISEREAIDVLVRRSRKNEALKPLISLHFPMHGFHS